MSTATRALELGLIAGERLTYGHPPVAIHDALPILAAVRLACPPRVDVHDHEGTGARPQCWRAPEVCSTAGSQTHCWPRLWEGTCGGCCCELFAGDRQTGLSAARRCAGARGHRSGDA